MLIRGMWASWERGKRNEMIDQIWVEHVCGVEFNNLHCMLVV